MTRCAREKRTRRRRRFYFLHAAYLPPSSRSRRDFLLSDDESARRRISETAQKRHYYASIFPRKRFLADARRDASREREMVYFPQNAPAAAPQVAARTRPQSRRDAGALKCRRRSPMRNNAILHRRRRPSPTTRRHGPAASSRRAQARRIAQTRNRDDFRCLTLPPFSRRASSPRFLMPSADEGSNMGAITSSRSVPCRSRPSTIARVQRDTGNTYSSRRKRQTILI